ncbi:uncharacterized mitochondrial protein AtMg00810-like [Helianthus annuus]|uniref:uncharacterized mitochondrial protein AtMg00810-like n=1 Tax=Helianthus annuus TaxID=4232 RepID=UPI000B906C96|nr:uncharacterized mitochondrial protein AtMg00810-like [Helianthus annuus]
MSISSVLLLDDSSPLVDPSRYTQTVGALHYVTLSRPDIAFAVNKVSQFMHAPIENHWAEVKRILRYLKGTLSLGLWIRHTSGYRLQAFTDSHWSTNLQAFSDSDWAGCPIDRRSMGGFAIYIGTNLISWSARKQKAVSRSSTESKYKAIADTIAELIWIKSLLRELGLNSEAQHYGVIILGKLNVKFISTDDQIVDIFTKPLSSKKFEFLRSKLQIATRPEVVREY